MDIWSKKKRSAVMAKIQSRDTKPEWIVRRYLFSRGYPINWRICLDEIEKVLFLCPFLWK